MVVQAKYREVGEQHHSDVQEQVKEMVGVLRRKLEDFAASHKEEIQGNPELRRYFQSLCSKIGVDPLSSKKGFWNKVLGVGDFYFEVGVRAVEVCLSRRQENGGLMSLDELLHALNSSKSAHQEIVKKDDVKRAVKKLEVLGDGFRLIKAGSKYFVQSVPLELNTDHISLLELAKETGFFTAQQVEERLGWTFRRLEPTLSILLQSEMVWLDTQGGSQEQYWFACLAL